VICSCARYILGCVTSRRPTAPSHRCWAAALSSAAATTGARARAGSYVSWHSDVWRGSCASMPPRSRCLCVLRGAARGPRPFRLAISCSPLQAYPYILTPTSLPLQAHPYKPTPTYLPLQADPTSSTRQAYPYMFSHPRACGSCTLAPGKRVQESQRIGFVSTSAACVPPPALGLNSRQVRNLALHCRPRPPAQLSVQAPIPSACGGGTDWRYVIPVEDCNLHASTLRRCALDTMQNSRAYCNRAQR